MMKNHESEVNVESIMQKIRKNIAHRKNGDLISLPDAEVLSPITTNIAPISRQPPVPAWIMKTPIWLALKNINAQMKRIRPYQKLYSYLYSCFEQLVSPPNGIFNIDDFFKYQEKMFIITAYSILIGCEPNKKTIIEYLDALQTGELSRLDILWRLRHSPEGKKQNVRIKRLTLRYAMQKFSRTP